MGRQPIQAASFASGTAASTSWAKRMRAGLPQVEEALSVAVGAGW
ncbi:MAG: hypothetical protein ABSF27_02820 [Candidatus Dormibacteria bacterium]